MRLPASLAESWGEHRGFMMSCRGLFGVVNVPMDEWVYPVLNALVRIALVSMSVYLVRICAQQDNSLSSLTRHGRQVVSDISDLTIRPNAPAGVYEIEIGVCNTASPAFDRLRVIANDRRIIENCILLGQVRAR